MATSPDDTSRIRAKMQAVGLSQDSRFGSIGINVHLQRLDQRTTSLETLDKYADHLAYLTQTVSLPADFWDAGEAVYQRIQKLAQPEYKPYLDLLGRTYARFTTFKQQETSGTDSALAAALDLLVYSAEYVLAGSPTDMLLKNATDEQQTLFLWQRLVSGSTRTLPVIHFTLYDHGEWGQDNVGRMWSFMTGDDRGSGVIWGVTGLAYRFVGDPGNTNQIEHMAISAVVQGAVNPLPFLALPALNLIEEFDWLSKLVRISRALTEADKAINNAVAYDLLKGFDARRITEARERMLRAVGVT